MKISKEEFAAKMDYSAVAGDMPVSSVEEVCKKALEYGYNAAYVLPCHTKWCREKFGAELKIGVPIGFPQGCNTTAIKIAEGLQAIEDGADSLDVVINTSMMLSGEYDYCKRELKEFVSKMKSRKQDIVIKVITECCLLNYEQKVEAFKMVLESGADVIKTSTGFAGYGARVSDVRLMRSVVGDKMRIKAAGDSEDAGAALELILAGADEIGNGPDDIDNQLATFEEYISLYK